MSEHTLIYGRNWGKAPLQAAERGTKTGDRQHTHDEGSRNHCRLEVAERGAKTGDRQRTHDKRSRNRCRLEAAERGAKTGDRQRTHNDKGSSNGCCLGMPGCGFSSTLRFPPRGIFSELSHLVSCTWAVEGRKPVMTGRPVCIQHTHSLRAMWEWPRAEQAAARGLPSWQGAQRPVTTPHPAGVLCTSLEAPTSCNSEAPP